MNLFNAALVTPTYYVYFTSSTIVASSVLFRGFKGTPISIATIIMGFLTICSGVILLQLSKSAKDVPDTAVLKGDLDQIRTVGEQEEPESEPKADAIRGTAALIRRISTSRQNREADEARRVYEEKLKDQMEPIAENEHVEWDGLRRRKTVVDPNSGEIQRRKTLHPPLGLTRFPSYREEDSVPEDHDRPDGPSRTTTPNSFFHSLRQRRSSSNNRIAIHPTSFSPRPPERSPIPEAETISVVGDKGVENGHEMRTVLGLPPTLRPVDESSGSSRVSPSGSQGKSIMWAPDAGSASRSREGLSPRPHTAGSGGRRQFSFHNVFHRQHSRDAPASAGLPESPEPAGARARLGTSPVGPRGRGRGISVRAAADGATEEERLGLVKGDSNQQAGAAVPSSSPAAGSPSDDSPASDLLRSALSPVRSASEIAVGLAAAPDPADRARPAPHAAESSPELRPHPSASAGSAGTGGYATERARGQERDGRHLLGETGHDGAFL